MWNYYIRLFFEASLELVFSCWFNLKYAYWWGDGDTPLSTATVICYTCAVFWFIIVVSLPLIILYFYCSNFHRLEDEYFDDTYGCVYEGLEVESRWVLVYPVVFVLRRSMLVVITIACYDFIWLQVVVQLAFSMFTICFVYLMWPFKEDEANRLDIFNECTTMLLIYFAYMFTDLTATPEDQFTVGYFWIIVFFGNIGFHLVLIAKSTTEDVIE